MGLNDLAEKLKAYRLSSSEYERMVQVLGREPRDIEWPLFSSLWSEHCSYKSSKIHLKKLFSKSSRVLKSFGENAGVIDLGLGEKIAFKMESHNHPSFIEPYQGAATGVGGILRDIFTMGARPIALANYLCFGEMDAPRMRALVKGVVQGIGDYGNCVGVPTVTGQTEFHASYNQNILVNAMAVGLFRKQDPITTSKASGVGNLVVYVGAKTGRDGVHGASMASESFSDSKESKKPTIQIGDPFYEKLLIESCLEIIGRGLVVAIQDMGAAGLTSSSFEMSAKGGLGFRLHLDKVPLRDSTMTPEQILLSESQERMLLICEPKNRKAIEDVFHKWDLSAVAIGEVLKTPNMELYWHGECLTSIDPKLLVDSAPEYDRARALPKRTGSKILSERKLNPTANAASAIKQILLDARATSRAWIYEQYDQRVGAKTAKDASETVAVVRLPDSQRGLGIVLGGRPHILRADAFEGGKDAVLYPALELAAHGFEPLALTDCLNFGSPENPEVMGEFVASIEGLSLACEALEIPVISGNVSFYNETNGKSITSTPATGLVGLRPSVDHLIASHFEKPGEAIYLLTIPQLAGEGMVAGDGARWSGEIRPSEISPIVKWLFELGRSDRLKSSRVVGKMGLGYALARMCMRGVGCRLKTSQDLFSETLYQVLLVGTPDIENEFAEFQSKSSFPGLELQKIGETGGERMVVEGIWDLAVDELKAAYERGLDVG